MECPDDDFLRRFVEDPDDALCELPTFEEHLVACPGCKSLVEKFASVQNASDNLRVFLGEPSQSPNLPQITGYHLEEFIGAGGFGSVYKGIQKSTGRTVAIKLVHQISPDHAKRIALEREILVRVDHPNIVSLIDTGFENGAYFFVYNWMEQSFSDYIKNTNAVDIRRAVRIVRSIGNAIQHLHEHGIIHRDVKPSNVLLSSTGHAKLTDFGIAKEFSSDHASSTLTHPVGTPGYMAPEQTGLLTSKVSKQTDVYGLGATLYCALTGRAPFQGGNSIQVVEQVVHDDPIPVRRLRLDVPKELETICLKCIEKDPTDRYDSAHSFIEDLDRFLMGDPILARPPGLTKRSIHWLGAHPRLRLGLQSLATTLAILFVVAVIVRHQWKKSETQSQISNGLNSLIHCQSEQLDAAFRVIDQLPSKQLFEQVIANNQIRPQDSIRLAMIDPNAIRSEQEQVDLLAKCRLEDVPVYLNRLSNKCDEQRRQRILQHLRERITAKDDAEVQLRFHMACLSLDSEPNLSHQSASEILTLLLSRPAAEENLWREGFQSAGVRLATVLSNSQVLTDSAQFKESSSLLRLAMRWSMEEPRIQFAILRNTHPKHLVILRESPELFRMHDLRAHAKEQRQAAIEATTPKRFALPLALQELCRQYTGLIQFDSGFLLKIPVEKQNEVLEQLKEAQFSPNCFQFWTEDSNEFLTITFDRADDEIEFERGLELDSFEDIVESKRKVGMQPVSFWPNGPLRTIDVLWRRTGSISSQIVRNETQINQWDVTLGKSEEGVSYLISHNIESHFTIAGSFNRLSNTTDRSDIVRNNPRSRKAEILRVELVGRQLSLGFRGMWPIQSLLYSSSESYLQKSQLLFEQGFSPIGTYCSQCEGQPDFCGIWGYKLGDRTESEKTRFLSAVICWLAEDVELVFEELRNSRVPDVRTKIIESLCQIDNRPDKVLAEIDRLNSDQVDELYGLLVASSKIEGSNLSQAQRLAWRKQIMNLVQHTDSGVHSAATWLGQKLLGANFDQSPFEPTVAPGFKHRSWFKSRSGIKFVVINPHEFQYLSNASPAPWTEYFTANLIKLDQPFCISVSEVTEAQMEDFLNGVGRLELQKGGYPHDTPDAPATGYRYEDVLMYCRWLSESEAIPEDKIGLPPIHKFDDSGAWDRDLIRMDGYRLPTAEEWQFAARCNALTDSFLGSSLDALSTFAWNSQNSRLRAEVVMQLAPNPWGLFDILGNDFEMLLSKSDQVLDPLPGKKRTVNYHPGKELNIGLGGGSFLSNRIYCNAALQNAIKFDQYDRNAGFRIVRTLLPNRDSPPSPNE